MLSKIINFMRNCKEIMGNNWEIWTRIGVLANAVNALENQVILLQQENEAMKENLMHANNTILDLHESIAFPTSKSRKLIADSSYDIQKVYTMMEEKAPSAFGIYKELMKTNNDEYQNEAASSCAVEGDIESIRFSKFMKRYIHGNVLDVGCGPIELPIYLKGYPTDLIYGLDPLIPHKEHPFTFVQGVAEKIPWEKNAFDTILFVTSFDHVFLIDLVMEEIKRVLTDDGYLLMWVSFDEEAKPYNPYANDFEPYDKFHMFHNTKQNYEELMNTSFEIIEYFKSNVNTHFYAMRKWGHKYEP